jgi:predicted SAM-dependent methyltransferase
LFEDGAPVLAEDQSTLSTEKKRILNAGAGPVSARGIAPIFRNDGWEEVRLDIDPTSKPNVIGSITEMTTFPDHGFDAIWSSHTLEHLFAHEVLRALHECKRVLKLDGFAIFLCPDLESVAEHLTKYGPDHVAYTSPAGPITALDMIYGHQASVARGRVAMAHKTGFTAERLGNLLLQAGFATVHVRRDEHFEICALAFAERADHAHIERELGGWGDQMKPSM